MDGRIQTDFHAQRGKLTDRFRHHIPRQNGFGN